MHVLVLSFFLSTWNYHGKLQVIGHDVKLITKAFLEWERVGGLASSYSYNPRDLYANLKSVIASIYDMYA